ncbi:Growth hormone-releasing hormone receptor [Varanus komodoensis]|nr:Growth hormone-releasing hormone receptor [Varanus komodoensis]
MLALVLLTVAFHKQILVITQSETRSSGWWGTICPGVGERKYIFNSHFNSLCEVARGYGTRFCAGRMQTLDKHSLLPARASSSISHSNQCPEKCHSFGGDGDMHREGSQDPAPPLFVCGPRLPTETQSWKERRRLILFALVFIGLVKRNCTAQGWTDPFPPYSIACPVDDDATLGEQMAFLSTIKTFYTVGYSISTTSLVVAVMVLVAFRRLHCPRNYIHIHLFLTFILKAVAIFIKDVVLFQTEDPDSCGFSTTECKISMLLCHYFTMSNFMWLLVEALYINALLLSSFAHGRRYFWWLVLFGWGVPTIFTILWIFVKVYFEDISHDWTSRQEETFTFTFTLTIMHYFQVLGYIPRISLQVANQGPYYRFCWGAYQVSGFVHMNGGKLRLNLLSFSLFSCHNPLALLEQVNFILFINIIRILLKKLDPRQINFNNSSQYRRLSKSTLLLIPLFGMHYILFNFLPDYTNVGVRLYLELCIGSFQGFIVAVLYCFLNQEVQAEICRKWRGSSYRFMPVWRKRTRWTMPSSSGIKMTSSRLARRVGPRVCDISPVLDGAAPPKGQGEQFGVLLDPELSLDSRVAAVAGSAFVLLRLGHQLQPYLDERCLAAVTHALVTSRLDYCSALCVGLPLTMVRTLRLVQKRAARILMGNSRYSHITSVLYHLHWLPVEVRAQFKENYGTQLKDNTFDTVFLHALTWRTSLASISLIKPRETLPAAAGFILCISPTFSMYERYVYIT